MKVQTFEEVDELAQRCVQFIFAFHNDPLYINKHLLWSSTQTRNSMYNCLHYSPEQLSYMSIDVAVNRGLCPTSNVIALGDDGSLLRLSFDPNNKKSVCVYSNDTFGYYDILDFNADNIEEDFFQYSTLYPKVEISYLYWVLSNTPNLKAFNLIRNETCQYTFEDAFKIYEKKGK